MFKRVIAATVLGISTLSIMAAHATSPGFYVTGQVGYAKSGISNSQFTDPSLTMDKVTGVIPGLVTIGKPSSTNDLAGRLAIGYQFTPNWGFELGYLQLGKQKSTIPVTYASVYSSQVIVHDEFVPLGTTTTSAPISINQHVFDLLAKGSYPLSDKFNVYAKAGIAYLTTNVSGGDFTGKIVLDNDSGTFSGKVTPLIAKHSWAPEVAVGFSYDLTANVFLDASLTHIQPIGKNKPNNIDFAALGIGYNFG